MFRLYQVLPPAAVSAACRDRLRDLDPTAISPACRAVEAAVRSLTLTGGETTAVAVAAANAEAGPDAPLEVVKLLKACAEQECVRLQLATVGEVIGQAGQARTWGGQALPRPLSRVIGYE